MIGRVMAGLLLISGPVQAQEWAPLVDGAGAEETFYTCSACHSLALVVQQGLSASRWQTILDQMIEEHGMNPPDAGDRTLIEAYLAAHYGEDRPNYPVSR